MTTESSRLDGEKMEPEINDCCFEGFEDSPACKSKRGFTCAHDRTLKWAAARRALGLDPLLVYCCPFGHVQHFKNDGGRCTACDKCGEEAMRLTPDEARQARIKVRFNTRPLFRLNS